MAKYSPERKRAVIEKMTVPNPPSMVELAAAEGISEATLYNWRQQARIDGKLLPDVDTGPEGWTAQDRFNAILETSGLAEADLAEYCRTRGLYPEQIARWREAAMAGCNFHASPPVPGKDVDRMRRDDKKQIAKLERELQRKEKALAEAAALLVLRKKFNEIMGYEEE